MALDPWVEAHLHLLHDMTDLGGFATPDGRAKWDEFFQPPHSYGPPSVRVDDVRFDRGASESPGRVLVYRPHDGEPSGRALVWMHGGGFTGGDVGMFEADGVCRELAQRSTSTIISVDYRLADVDTTFPTPVLDVLDAIRWARANASQLGIEEGGVSVGGASAGAVLAMSATLMLRDAGEHLPQKTVLIYPGMHATLPPLPHELVSKLEVVPQILNYRPSTERPESNPALRAFLGGPEWLASPHSTPGLADLNDLPPTLLVNAEYDALRASGQLFAAQLAQAGNDVTVRNERGVLHGYLNLAPVLGGVSATLDTIATFLGSGPIRR